MPVLLDSNQLLRIAEPHTPEYPIVRDAIIKYVKRGDRPLLCPQTLHEFWTVATRPAGTAANGLGMTKQEAEAEVAAFETFFPILPDTAAMYDAWRVLIRQYDVLGLQAHDARLIAAMIAHQVPTLLTLNVKHFKRYLNGGIVIAGQPLQILRPQDV